MSSCSEVKVLSRDPLAQCKRMIENNIECMQSGRGVHSGGNSCIRGNFRSAEQGGNGDCLQRPLYDAQHPVILIERGEMICNKELASFESVDVEQGNTYCQITGHDGLNQQYNRNTVDVSKAAVDNQKGTKLVNSETTHLCEQSFNLGNITSLCNDDVLDSNCCQDIFITNTVCHKREAETGLEEMSQNFLNNSEAVYSTDIINDGYLQLFPDEFVSDTHVYFNHVGNIESDDANKYTQNTERNSAGISSHKCSAVFKVARTSSVDEHKKTDKICKHLDHVTSERDNTGSTGKVCKTLNCFQIAGDFVDNCQNILNTDKDCKIHNCFWGVGNGQSTLNTGKDCKTHNNCIQIAGDDVANGQSTLNTGKDCKTHNNCIQSTRDVDNYQSKLKTDKDCKTQNCFQNVDIGQSRLNRCEVGSQDLSNKEMQEVRMCLKTVDQERIGVDVHSAISFVNAYDNEYMKAKLEHTFPSSKRIQANERNIVTILQTRANDETFDFCSKDIDGSIVNNTSDTNRTKERVHIISKKTFKKPSENDCLQDIVRHTSDCRLPSCDITTSTVFDEKKNPLKYGCRTLTPYILKVEEPFTSIVNKSKKKRCIPKSSSITLLYDSTTLAKTTHKTEAHHSVIDCYSRTKMPDKKKEYYSIINRECGVSVSIINSVNTSRNVHALLLPSLAHFVYRQLPHSMTRQFSHPVSRQTELYKSVSADNLTVDDVYESWKSYIKSVKQDTIVKDSSADSKCSQNTRSVTSRTDCSISNYRQGCCECDDQKILNCFEHDTAKPSESYPSNRKESKATYCLGHVEGSKHLTRNPMTQWTKLINANMEAILENKRVEVDHSKFEGGECQACIFGTSEFLFTSQSLNIENTKSGSYDSSNLLWQDECNLWKDDCSLQKVHSQKNHKVNNDQKTSKIPDTIISFNSLEQKHACCNKTDVCIVNKHNDGKIDTRSNNTSMKILEENELESSETDDWHWYSVMSGGIGCTYSQDHIGSYCHEREIYDKKEVEMLDEKHMNVCENHEMSAIQDISVDISHMSLTPQINTEPAVICTLSSVVHIGEPVEVYKHDINSQSDPVFVRNHTAYTENEISDTTYEYANGNYNNKECIESGFRHSDMSWRQCTGKDRCPLVINDCGSYDRKEVSTDEVGAQDITASEIVNDSECLDTTVLGLDDSMKDADSCKNTSNDKHKCMTMHTFDSSETAQTSQREANTCQGVIVSEFDCCDVDVDIASYILDIHGGNEHLHFPRKNQFMGLCANDHRQDTTTNTRCKIDTRIDYGGITASDTLDRKLDKLATNSSIQGASRIVESPTNISSHGQNVVICTQHSGCVASLHDDAISDGREDEAGEYQSDITLRCGNSLSKNPVSVSKSACILNVPAFQHSVSRKNGLYQSTSAENLARGDACRSYTFCVKSMKPNTVYRKSYTEIRGANNGKSDVEIKGVHSRKPDTEIEHANSEKFDTEIRSANNDTEIRSANNDTEIRSANNDTEIRSANNDTEIRGANNDTEIRRVNNDTEIRGANYDTEIRGANYDTEIRDANNDTEIRGANNDTEIRNANNDTEIRGANNDTEIRGANYDTEIRGANYDTEIRGANYDTEIRGANYDTEIRGANYDTEIRGANNNTAIRGANNATEIRRANNNTEIRDTNNGKSDTGIRNANSEKCDTEIRSANNDIEITSANETCDTEIRGANNDTEIRSANEKCDTEIRSADNGICVMPLADCSGYVWRERYNLKDNHDFLHHTAAEKMSKSHYRGRIETKAVYIEDSNKTVKHLTRNPVTQWTRLVNANIEAVLRTKTETIDQQKYDDRDFEPCVYVKSGSVPTTQHVNIEKIKSGSCNANTLQFSHSDYHLDTVHKKEYNELRNNEKVYSIPETIVNLNSQELNTACRKTVSNIVNETCSDDNIDATSKNMTMKAPEKIKPEKVEFTEKDEWHWYSINLGSIGCTYNPDCLVAYPNDSEMNTYAQKEVKVIVDENCDYVVNEVTIVNRPPVLSALQFKNISNDTVCTKPVCETECVETNTATRKEENIIFIKECIEYSKDTRMCNEQENKSDYFNNDNSKNELNTDEVYAQDLTNRRIADISESLEINEQVIIFGHRNHTDSVGNVCNDKYIEKRLNNISTSNERVHAKRLDTVQSLQTDVCNTEFDSCSNDFDFDSNNVSAIDETMKHLYSHSEKEFSVQCGSNHHEDAVRHATLKSDTQVCSSDITTSEVSYEENKTGKVRATTLVPSTIDTEVRSTTLVPSSIDTEVRSTTLVPSTIDTTEVRSKSLVPFTIDTEVRSNSDFDEKHQVNYSQQSGSFVCLLDDIDTINTYTDKKTEYHLNIDLDCGGSLSKRNSVRISKSAHALIMSTFPHSVFKQNRLYDCTSAENIVPNDRHKTRKCQHKVRKSNRLSRISNSAIRDAVTGKSISQSRAELSGDGCRRECIEDDKTRSLQCLQQATINISQLHPSNSENSKGKYCMVQTQESNGTLKHLTRNPVTQWTRLVNDNIEAVFKTKVGEIDRAKYGGGDFAACTSGKSKNYAFPDRCLEKTSGESETGKTDTEKLCLSSDDILSVKTVHVRPGISSICTDFMDTPLTELVKIVTSDLGQSGENKAVDYVCSVADASLKDSLLDYPKYDAHGNTAVGQQFPQKGHLGNSCTDVSADVECSLHEKVCQNTSEKNGSNQDHLCDCGAADWAMGHHDGAMSRVPSGDCNYLNANTLNGLSVDEIDNEPLSADICCTENGDENLVYYSLGLPNLSKKTSILETVQSTTAAEISTDVSGNKVFKKRAKEIWQLEHSSSCNKDIELILEESVTDTEIKTDTNIDDFHQNYDSSEEMFLLKSQTSDIKIRNPIISDEWKCAKTYRSVECKLHNMEQLNVVHDEHSFVSKTVSLQNRITCGHLSESEIRVTALNNTHRMFNCVAASDAKAAVSPSADCLQYLKCENNHQETHNCQYPISFEGADAKLQCKISQQQIQQQILLNQWNSVSLTSPFWHSKRRLNNLDVTIYVHKRKGCDNIFSKNKSIDCDDKVCITDTNRDENIISRTDKRKYQENTSRTDTTKDVNTICCTNEKKYQETISSTDNGKDQDKIFSIRKRKDKKDKISSSHNSTDKDIISIKDKSDEHNNISQMGVAIQISENNDRVSSNSSTEVELANVAKQGRAIEVLDELSCDDRSYNTGWSRFWHFMTHMFTNFSKPPPHENDVANQELIIQNKQSSQDAKISDHKHKVECFKGDQGQECNELGSTWLCNMNSLHDNENNEKQTMNNARSKYDSEKHRKQKTITGIKLISSEENSAVTEYGETTVTSTIESSNQKTSSVDTDAREPKENILFGDQIVDTCVGMGYFSSDTNIEKCSYFLVPQDHSNNDANIKNNHDKSQSESSPSGNQETCTDSEEFSGLCESKKRHNKTKIPVFISRHSKNVIQDFSNIKMTRRCHESEGNSLKRKRKHKHENGSKVRNHNMLETGSFVTITGNNESEQERVCDLQIIQDKTPEMFLVESTHKTTIYEDISQCQGESTSDDTLQKIGAAQTHSRKNSATTVRRSASIRDDTDNTVHLLHTPARIIEKITVNTKSVSNEAHLSDYFQDLVTVNHRAPDISQHAQGSYRDEFLDQTGSELLQSSLECLLEMLLHRGKVTHAFIANAEGEIMAKTARCSVTTNGIKSILFSLCSSYRGMVKIAVVNDVYTCFKHDQDSLVGRASTNIFVARRGRQSIVVGFSDAVTPGSCIREVQEISELLSHRGL